MKEGKLEVASNMVKSFKEYIIAVISDIIFEPYFIPLIEILFGNNVKIHPVPYKECNEKKYIEIIKLAEMLVVWLNFESLLPDIYNAAFLNASMEQNTIKIYSMQCEKLYTVR